MRRAKKTRVTTPKTGEKEPCANGILTSPEQCLDILFGTGDVDARFIHEDTNRQIRRMLVRVCCSDCKRPLRAIGNVYYVHNIHTSRRFLVCRPCSQRPEEGETVTAVFPM